MKSDQRDFSKLLLTILTVGSDLVTNVVTAQGRGLLSKAAEVERRLGAGLGFSLLEGQSGRRWTYQADQRFPMCSTFKVLASSAFLARVDRGEDNLERRVIILSHGLRAV